MGTGRELGLGRAPWLDDEEQEAGVLAQLAALASAYWLRWGGREVVRRTSAREHSRGWIQGPPPAPVGPSRSGSGSAGSVSRHRSIDAQEWVTDLRIREAGTMRSMSPQAQGTIGGTAPAAAAAVAASSSASPTMTLPPVQIAAAALSAGS